MSGTQQRLAEALHDDDFDPRYDCELVMPSECDWGWCNGETVAYREDGDDELPVCQLHLDHQPEPDVATCREDGSPWPCGVERHARRSLAEVQAARAAALTADGKGQ